MPPRKHSKAGGSQEGESFRNSQQRCQGAGEETELDTRRRRSIKPIGKWSNVHFTDRQKADYVAGKTVKVEGYIDKQGKESTVYVKFDPVKGRPFPHSTNPDEAQSIKPAAESETQFAVNNEGKTNEATKNVNEPLQKGQTAPKDEEQQKQQRKPKGPKI